MTAETVYFTDFDGTIALNDVFNTILERFASEGWQELDRAYKQGRLPSRDCVSGQFALVNTKWEDLLEHILSQEIDPHFPEFVHWCKKRGHSLVVLSGGLDLYLQPILEKYGLKDMKVFSNHGWYENGRIVVDFPYYRADCQNGCHCGNCKIMHMEPYAAMKRVYIGDGFSDRYAARLADRVYAKCALAEYCRQNSIDYIPFEDFGDVLRLESTSPAVECR